MSSQHLTILVSVQVVLLISACGAIDQMGDKYYYRPTEKAGKWVEERKAEDAEYAKERPEVIAKAQKEAQDEVDQEIEDALHDQVQMYCVQIPELRSRWAYCDEVQGAGDSSGGPYEGYTVPVL